MKQSLWPLTKNNLELQNLLFSTFRVPHVNKDGYKVYIYEKIKESKPITQEKENKVDNKENKKEVSNKKEELPKTSSSMLSTVGLLSIFGVRKNRKKNK